METIKVLLVDDDVTYGNVVMLTLRELGYDAYYQSSLSAINEVICDIKPDVIILDVEIGPDNSIDIIHEIKAVAKNIPIIFVSSHTDGLIAARAIELGGSAYLRKPLKNEELIANINRHIRPLDVPNLKFGKFVLDNNERSLHLEGELVKLLSSTEYKLLKLLVLNINTVVDRDTLINKVWGKEIVSGHSITNFIAKLRRYISEDNEVELVTVPNVGYKLISKYVMSD